ncbi:MAG TPA: hypothetical protein VFY85_08995 [Gemmatimonadaceae bacterium]|nr:hypothetical protein [Gemmatimonadaceae bacterium]
MQIVREPTGNSSTRLHEIMHHYTPPMRRVCPHLSDEELCAMIERMAKHKLEEELAIVRRARRRERTGPVRRARGTRPTLVLVS